MFTANVDCDRRTHHEATIRNCAWLVRHYGRGRRSSIMAAERQAALERLGCAIRAAFDEARGAEDFETFCRAVVDGLVPRDEPRF